MEYSYISTFLQMQQWTRQFVSVEKIAILKSDKDTTILNKRSETYLNVNLKIPSNCAILKGRKPQRPSFHYLFLSVFYICIELFCLFHPTHFLFLLFIPVNITSITQRESREKNVFRTPLALLE